MFENFISLGIDCLVAAALGKHGLRSATGPFDWCVTPLESVIVFLENDFDDFMNYENLKEDKERPWLFDDVKYSIGYPHDIKDSLQKDYPDIVKKYEQKIECFREMIQKPTCFVRGVSHMRELSVLIEEEERINNAIKHDNGNEIIFVVPRYIYEQNPIQSSFKIFLVDTLISGFDLGREESRSFFDTNQELIDFCINNYSVDKRKDNLIFDLRKELLVEQKRNRDAKTEKEIIHLKRQIMKHRLANVRLENRLAKWEKILNTDYSCIHHAGKIAIYGCDTIGKTLYNQMKKQYTIIEFIDRRPRRDKYDGIPVNMIENTISDENTLIIVIPSHDIDAIKLELRLKLKFSPKILSVEEFLAKMKVKDPYF